MISVIIPLYNKEKSIRATIQSVLCQTYADFELIILNDGSTDKSLLAVQEFDDPRIRIINKVNEGVSATRNRGVIEANSDLIFFLDADDYIYPDCLQVLSDETKNYPNASLWSANFEAKKKGSKAKRVLSLVKSGYIHEPHRLVYTGNWLFRIGSYVVSKNAFLQCGGFPENVCVGEDYLFLDKFCSQYTCAYIPTVVMVYQHEYRSMSMGNTSYIKTAEWFFDFVGKNKWQQLSYSELIFKRMIKAFFRFDYSESIAMLKKYGMRNVIGIYSLICKPIISNHR